MLTLPVLQVFLYLTCTNSYTVFQEVPLDDPQRSNPIDANQLVKWNARYSGDIFWAMKVGHIGACAVMCIRMTMCASFNFDLYSHMCEINSNVRDYQTDLLLWKQNSVFSKIQDWPNKLDPHCHHRPCARDEVCLPREVASLLNVNFNVQCLKNHASQTTRSEPTLTTSTSTSTTTTSTSTSTTSTPTPTTSTTPTPTTTTSTTPTPTTTTLTTSTTSTSTSTTSTPTSTSSTSTSPTTTLTTSTTPTSTSTTSTSTSTTPTSTSTTSTTSTTSASYADCLAGIEGYSGNIAETNNGQTCQYWTAQSPHTHWNTDADFPYDGSLADANNYCREVDDTARPWCFTTNPEIRWGYCTFKICQVVPSPCGGTLTGTSGSITIPPTPGTTNFDCVWFIRAANNNVIQYQVEVLKSNGYSECGEFTPLSVMHSSSTLYLCDDEYHYEHGVTSSDTLMVYYYTDENVPPLNFTLYYRTKADTDTNTWNTCFPLRSPENGNVDVLDATPVGQTASYTCNDCFMLHGTEQRTCRPSGTWDGAQPSCVATPTYNNSCYYFFMTNITWWDAVDTCEDLHDNAYLLELESEDENNFVINTLNSMEGALNNDWWIGLSDIDGDFHWEVNTIGLPYTNWLLGSGGSPNGAGEDDNCAILYHAEGLRWAERDCNDRYYFICELDHS